MNIKPHYSPSVEAGPLVFVSGQLPFDSERKVVPGGIRAQTAQCIENIRAILATRGLGLEHVVKTTIWLTRTGDFAEFNSAYATAFPQNPPARSTVRADLMADAALIEIEAVACRLQA